MVKPKIYILTPTTTPKPYISGHNIRRFFHVTEQDLINIRRNHKEKIVDNGFYKLYDVGFLKTLFKMRGDIPDHLIISE